MKEILIKVDNNIFGLKVSAICFCNNHVLLKKNKSGTFSFPGGNIGFNENSKAALLRKLSEETDAVFHIGDMKIVCEDTNASLNPPCHEVCFYYKATLLDKKLLSINEFKSSKNADEIFVWFPIDKIETVKIKPSNAADIIKRIIENKISHLKN